MLLSSLNTQLSINCEVQECMVCQSQEQGTWFGAENAGRFHERTVVMSNGRLVIGEGGGVDEKLTVWDTVSGRIPICEQKQQRQKGLEKKSTTFFLRRYGDRVHKEMWSKMWIVRRREMAKMEGLQDWSSVCSYDMEEVDRSGEDHMSSDRWHQ